LDSGRAFSSTGRQSMPATALLHTRPDKGSLNRGPVGLGCVKSDGQSIPGDLEVPLDGLAYVTGKQGTLEVMNDNSCLFINSVRAEVGVISQDGLRGIVRSLDLLRCATLIRKHFHGSTRSRKLRGNVTGTIVNENPTRGRRQS